MIDESVTFFVTRICLTQSGMTTARRSSCRVIPRSSASFVRAWKLSSRSESMNLAIDAPKWGERVAAGAAHINILEKSKEFFP